MPLPEAAHAFQGSIWTCSRNNAYALSTVGLLRPAPKAAEALGNSNDCTFQRSMNKTRGKGQEENLGYRSKAPR